MGFGLPPDRCPLGFALSSGTTDTLSATDISLSSTTHTATSITGVSIRGSAALVGCEQSESFWRGRKRRRGDRREELETSRQDGMGASRAGRGKSMQPTHHWTELTGSFRYIGGVDQSHNPPSSKSPSDTFSHSPYTAFARPAIWSHPSAVKAATQQRTGRRHVVERCPDTAEVSAT